MGKKELEVLSKTNNSKAVKNSNVKNSNVKKSKVTKRTKVLRVVAIVVVFFLISNAIATKIIYDNIFCRYDKNALTDEIAAKYSELLDSREELFVEDELKAYFYDVQDEKGIVVIAPGLHAGANHYLAMTQYLTENGYDVFSFDPYGTIDSKGKSCVGFSKEIEDLDKVLAFVEATYPNENEYVIGHSRGAFAACSMIGSNHDIDAVVSVSGLNSAMEAVIGLSSRYVGPVANANYFCLWLYQVMLFDKATMDVRADKKINAGNVPVLIIQGSADKTAPVEKYSIYSHKNELDSEKASFIFCDKDGQNDHTDLLYAEDGISPNEELMSQIVEFIGAIN